MHERYPFPEKDVFGRPLQPGDAFVHDALGRPVKVHPSRLCGRCGLVRDGDNLVCPGCGSVPWRRPISTTLTAGVFLVGAFAGEDYFAAPWSKIVFWTALVVGGLFALNALSLWHFALKGVGVEILRLVGGALLLGGLGWLIDWWRIGEWGGWAIGGSIVGASFELFAQQWYYYRGESDR